MRARVLLRNSTDRQARAGTIAAQRRPVRELAARLGAVDVVEYVEEAVSGATPLDERDVLRRLLAEAEAGDLVCAFDMSRLTRSDDWIERYGVLGQIRRAGLRAATIDDGEIDFLSIGGRITTHIRGEIAADERSKIRGRTMAGKRNAAERGQKPQGVTPWGLAYDRLKKAWGLDEPAAAIVREVYARIGAGETCGAIAADLSARAVGYPARGAARGGERTTWTARRAWHLATQPVYRGTWTFGGHAIAVPAIVDAATWHTAQARLLEAGRRGLRRTSHVYLLDEGIGRCGLCAGALRVHWGGTGGTTSYYTCERARGKGCTLRWWRTEEADRRVWQAMRAAVLRPDFADELLGERAAKATTGASDVAALGVRLERLASVEAAIMRQFRAGRVTEAAFVAETDSIARERADLDRALGAAVAAAERSALSDIDAARVRATVAKLALQLGGVEPAQRRETVRSFAPVVALEPDRIRVRFSLVGSIALGGSPCSCTESHCDRSHARAAPSVTLVA